MNPYLSAFVLSVPMVVAAPYVAAETHPAQAQMQQNIDAVLKIARNGSLSEAQKVKQIEPVSYTHLTLPTSDLV